MTKAGKKRAGRPRGQAAPHRPVIGARVPQALYDAIKAAAAAAGRTMSEELVWRAEKAGEWSKAFGELDEWRTKTREEQAEIARKNLEVVCMGYNWKKVRGVPFGSPNWISADNHSYPQSGFVDPASPQQSGWVDVPPEAGEAKPAQPKKRQQQ